jgi:hypothetical protein
MKIKKGYSTKTRKNLLKYLNLMGNINIVVERRLVKKFARIERIMHWLYTFFYTGAKFGPLEKRIKTVEISRDEIFQKNSRYTLFDHKSNEEIFENLKAESADENLRRYKSNCL